MIFDGKGDLRRKSRLVIGVHVVDSYGNKVYAGTIKLVLSKILMKITSANNLEVMMGDIGNAYLKANTKENIYNRAGAEFELVGIMDKGTLLEVFKALYGLTTSGNSFHEHLLHTLR